MALNLRQSNFVHILMVSSLLLVLFLTNLHLILAHQYFVKTIAGLGVCDGTPAIGATIYGPTSARMNSMGELIIADNSHHRIRKVFTNGTITTIAGVNSFPGYNGDGILATEASLNSPYGIAIDLNDEIYFSDSGNHRVRKILSNGTIITVAGTGSASYNYDNILAIDARINTPKGLYFNSSTSELYIADSFNGRVRKVLANGTITTIAGIGTSGTFNANTMLATLAYLRYPYDIHGNSKGELFVADYNSKRIRKISADGYISTFAGNGLQTFNGDNIVATTAGIGYPYGVYYSERTQEVYIADNFNHRIRKVLTNGTITTVAGIGVSGKDGDGGLATQAKLNSPSNVFEYNDELYISDKGNNRIRRVLSNGIIETVAGNGFKGFCADGALASTNELYDPKGIYVTTNDEIYMAEYTGHRIRKILSNGTIITIAGTGGQGYNGDGILAINAQLNYPTSVTLDSQGQIIIAESVSCIIRKILTNGTIITIAGTRTCGYSNDNLLATNSKLYTPFGVAVDSSDQVYFSEPDSYRVRTILPNGTITTVAGIGSSGTLDTGIAKTSQLKGPYGISFDLNDNLYISDSGGNKIRMVYPNGTMITIAGSGSSGFIDNTFATQANLYNPYGVITNSSNGELFILDSYNYRVRKVYNGNITTIAGTGLSTYNGDNMIATSANFRFPYGIGLKSNGEIVVTDSNGMLRVLVPFLCNGISPSDSNVCNGNGICIEPDVCSCNDGFNGTFCENGVNHSTISTIDNSTITNSTIDNSTLTNSTIEFNTSNSNDNSTDVNNSTIISNTTQYSNASQDSTQNATNINNNTLVNTTSNSNENSTDITNSTVTSNTTQYSNTSQNSTIDNSTLTNSTSVTNSSIFNNSTSNDNSTDVNNSTIISNTTQYSNTTQNTTIDVYPNLNNSTGNTSINSNSSTAINSSNITCFGIDSSNSSVCNSNGKCKSKDLCECYSNSTFGYFTSPNCLNCEMDYYGQSCLSKFVGPLRFSNDTKSVEISITSPYWYTLLNVKCSDLIHSDDLKLFGNVPKCYWKQKETNNLLSIELGNGFELKIGDSIRFNTFIFEKLSKSSNYVSFIVESPLNSMKPNAIISTRQILYSTCESVLIDASNSYSLDGKPLSFIWTLMQSPNSIPILLTNSSILTISNSQSSFEGIYIVRLQVESSFTKLKSESIDFKFTKENRAVPILKIDTPSNQINVKTLNVPIIIEKKVSFASCYSNISTSQIKIEWKQMGGNTVDYQINSNSDLVITNFPIKGDNKYSFNVTAIFEGKSISTDITIQTTSEDLFSNLYVESLSTEKASIIIERQDVEQSNEIETWTLSCIDSSQSIVGCGNVIDTKLSNYGQMKQSSIELKSNEFNSISNKIFIITLRINKGQRSISNSIELQFATESMKLPPLISLLNVSPNRKKLTLNDILNLQLSITKSDSTDLINMERKWTLNGESIPSSCLEKMSLPITSSNSIILMLNQLVEGSNNILTLQVTDLDTQLSNSYSYSFTIAKSPPSCPCIVSPSTGYALETDFTFTCSNCQNSENSLTFSLSFVDDKSGANIPLVINGGNTFSTKLPYPITNPLVFNIEIVDSDTGASIKNYQQISILLPLASSVKEVKTKVSKWNTIQNSLQQNDLRRMIFNSAIISRTSEAMISALSKRRSIKITCLNGGTFNSEKGKCICLKGFSKKDCSLTIEDFTILTQFKKELFNNFYSAFENNSGKISEMFLIYQLYGLDSLLSNYDEIDEETFTKSVYILKNLVDLVNENEYLKVSTGVDKLCTNILNSFHNYLVYNDCEHCVKGSIIKFSPILKIISQILLRSRYIGESDLKLNVEFISFLTNRNYRYQFKNMNASFDSNNTVTIQSNDQTTISNRVLLTFISTITPNYLSNLPTKLISQTNQTTQTNRNVITSLLRTDSIISNLISFTFKDIIPLNQSLTFSFKRSDNNILTKSISENRIERSCVLIQNYTNILTNNDCKLTMDNENYYCTCSQNSNNTQLAILKSEFSEKTEEKNLNNSNDLLYLLFLLVILVIALIVIIVIIVVVLCCCCAKRKKNKHSTTETTQKQEEVLQTV